MQATLAPTPTNGNVQHKTNGIARKDQSVYQVMKTSNPSQFKILPDNRNLNLLHVRRLVESFKEKHLISPIIVNERYEVIDGQHRLEASKETGMPIYYIMIKGYGIKEVQVFNTNQKNWTKLDWLNMYCAEGKRAYLELKEFMNDFPDFQFQAAERIMSLRGSHDKTKREDGKSISMKDFQNGKLVVPNLSASYSVARRLLDFKPYYAGFNKGIFVSTMLPLLLNGKKFKYDHKEMMHKISTCPIKMTDCLDVDSYKLLLEDIYNYKRQKENKVSFRYSK